MSEAKILKLLRWVAESESGSDCCATVEPEEARELVAFIDQRQVRFAGTP